MQGEVDAMPTDYSSVNVKCPFYLAEENNKIICEGMEKGSRTALEFRGRQFKESVKERYCNSNFEQCKLYHVIDDKYK